MEVVALRQSGTAPRLRATGRDTAVRLLRSSSGVALGGEGLHALTALRRRCASRGRVKRGGTIPAGERGSGGGSRKCDEQGSDEFCLHDVSSLNDVSRKRVSCPITR